MTAPSFDPLAYGDALQPHHAELLWRSAISPAIATQRGYRTITDPAELETTGYGPTQRRKTMLPVLFLPVWTVDGRQVGSQIRPDHPRLLDRSGQVRTLKYESPKDVDLRLDVHPSQAKAIGNPRRPLIVTEGIRKGDAAASQGWCAVSLIGVWGFRGKNLYGGLTALPDWEKVALNGRQVYVVFDSDVMLKPEVRAALTRLGAFLGG